MGQTVAASIAGEPPGRRHLAWLLICVAYVFVFPYYERINNPNENVRIWLTRAIVEHGTLNIDPVEREWGWVNDKSTANKKMYSAKAPGTSFLGVPILFAYTKVRQLSGLPSPGKRATTFWLRLFAVALPLCVFLWFFARHLERTTRSQTARDLLLAALGAGTLFYPYGVIFVGHSLAAAAAFSAYMLLAPTTRARPPSPAAAPAPPPGRWRSLPAAGAGFSAGLAVTFEYQAVFVALILSVYAVARLGRRFASFAAGALAPAVALGAYHHVTFGRPWKFPFAAVENPEFVRIGHSQGFHGLALPKLNALGQIMFAPEYGLFIFSPILLLGLLCAVYLAVRGPRREGLLVLAVAVVMFLFLSGMAYWRAGWCVGPRYITAVAPFLVSGIAWVWPAVQRRTALSVLAAGLLLPSVTLNAVSAALYPHYPMQYNNPVFDLAFPLIRDGFVPYSLGQWLGLRGGWSLFPLAALLVVLVSLSAGGEDPRPGRRALHASAAVLIAALFLLPLSRYGRAPDPSEDHATQLVRSAWEPPRLKPPANRRR
jgi:hypothetical protein